MSTYLRIQVRMGEGPVADALNELAAGNGESVNELVKRILRVYTPAATKNPAINLTIARQVMATELSTTSPPSTTQNQPSVPAPLSVPETVPQPLAKKIDRGQPPSIEMSEL
ncbi:MAG: hypothetical protein AAF329_20455 [Cyanobacteria bacterium P01_A01_bin.17]